MVNTSLKTYRFRAKTLELQTIKGTIQARNALIATVKLQQQDLKVQHLRLIWLGPFLFKFRALAPREVIQLFNQLGHMIVAGIPLARALQILSQSTENPRLSMLIDQVYHQIEEGRTFTEALSQHPQHFNRLVCRLIQLGEMSGTLEKIVFLIATHLERREMLKKTLQQAMYYPVTVMVIAFCVILFMLLILVPEFESLFTELDAPLPILTQGLVGISHLLSAHMVCFVLTGLISLLVGAYFKKNKKLNSHIDRVLFHIPFVGALLKKALLTRFAKTLCLTYNAGLPLYEGLELVGDATDNFIFSNIIHQIKIKVAMGQSLQAALHLTRWFPAGFVQCIAISEETGTLDSGLAQLASYYETALDHQIKAFTGLLEPIMMLFLGFIVGLILLTLYLPLLQLGKMI